MAPFYAGYDANFRLHSDDIAAIQSLYGACCLCLFLHQAGSLRLLVIQVIPQNAVLWHAYSEHFTAAAPLPCCVECDSVCRTT